MDKQKADCERVMNDVLTFAERMLREKSEFHPFGACSLDDGSIVQVGMLSEVYGEGSGAMRAKELEEKLRSIAGAMRAQVVAMATNITVRDVEGGMMDVIKIDVEHRLWYSAEIFFSYLVSEAGQLDLATPTAQKGRAGRFFPSEPRVAP